MKPLADGSRAVAFVNYSKGELDQYVRWSQIGLPPGPAKVRDLWAHKDLGTHTDTGKHYNERFQVKVPSHGVVMVRIWPRDWRVGTRRGQTSTFIVFRISTRFRSREKL